jgi:hypothetical protein
LLIVKWVVVAVALFAVVLVGFVVVLRAAGGGDEDPAVSRAQARAHELLATGESLSSPAQRAGSGYLFRVVQRPTGGQAVASTEATHDGIVVCGSQAIRFSFLHWRPACPEPERAETSVEADGRAWGGPFVADALARDSTQLRKAGG